MVTCCNVLLSPCKSLTFSNRIPFCKNVQDKCSFLAYRTCSLLSFNIVFFWDRGGGQAKIQVSINTHTHTRTLACKNFILPQHCWNRKKEIACWVNYVLPNLALPVSLKISEYKYMLSIKSTSICKYLGYTKLFPRKRKRNEMKYGNSGQIINTLLCRGNKEGLCIKKMKWHVNVMGPRSL